MTDLKIVILDALTLGDDISLEEISSLGECEIYSSTSVDELPERLENAEVAVLNKVKLNSGILSFAKKLKLICLAATGFDNIDIDYCKKNGIAVCNVVGYSSHNVAQLTAAMVLSLSVNLCQYTDFVKRGEYTESRVANKLTPVYHELFGKTWGIIGYGNIGKEVAQVARALGCNVIYNKNKQENDKACVSLEELCSKADIISIHTPLNDSTRGMINEKTISLMKNNVILVNTARGAVTDESAVAKAIKEKQIAAFGTDVYSVEPFGKDHPFYSIKDYPNVCMTPHMAWGSYEARCRCISEITENIKSFFSGKIRNRLDI